MPTSASSTPSSHRTANRTAAGSLIAEPLIGSPSPSELHVMTFNIRLDCGGTFPGEADYWPERVPALQRLLRLELPTVLGVQEALLHQLEAIEDCLPGGYRRIGQGRDGGNEGEFSAIFYDSRRLTLLDSDQFWLSDTPRMPGSATWGNTTTRIMTRGRFRDRQSGRELQVINSHFDHLSENARVKSAEAVLQLVRSTVPEIPTVLTADFNAAARSSSTHAAFVESGMFKDAWDAAQRRLTPAYGTFLDYKDPVEGGDRIDWILASPEFQVLGAGVNPFTLEGRYPSDHAPVQALLRLS